MTSETGKSPSRRLLLLVGASALAIAGGVAGFGIVNRNDAHQQLAQWTSQASVPTVQLAQLQRGGAVQSLVLPGNIQPYFKAAIYSRVTGYLKSWQEDIGAKVKAGQLLASIDAPDLDQQVAQARANLATAEANEQVATVTAERWHSLVNTQAVSQQAYDEKAGTAAANKAIADAAQAYVRQLEAMESYKNVVAPFDGVVTRRNTDVGALVNAGNSGSAGPPLFDVSDLHKVRIYVQVPQAFLAGLTPGLKATFDMPQYPGQHFEATLVTTSHALDPASRSMQVELQADNPDGRFAQGSYCQVHFQLPSDPNMVQVPASALFPVNQGVQVAVLGEGNKVGFKTVQLGRDLGDSVEVTAGLAATDQVIDSPPETLQSGDVVQLAPAASSAAAPAPAPAPAKGSPAAAGSPPQAPQSGPNADAASPK